MLEEGAVDFRSGPVLQALRTDTTSPIATLRKAGSLVPIDSAVRVLSRKGRSPPNVASRKGAMLLTIAAPIVIALATLKARDERTIGHR